MLHTAYFDTLIILYIQRSNCKRFNILLSIVCLSVRLKHTRYPHHPARLAIGALEGKRLELSTPKSVKIVHGSRGRPQTCTDLRSKRQRLRLQLRLLLEWLLAWVCTLHIDTIAHCS